jgi:hypothetical protein
LTAGIHRAEDGRKMYARPRILATGTARDAEHLKEVEEEALNMLRLAAFWEPNE